MILMILFSQIVLVIELLVLCIVRKFEHYGNYVPSVLSKRYDAFIYLDETKALHPLHIEPHGHEMPDTYPFVCKNPLYLN